MSEKHKRIAKAIEASGRKKSDIARELKLTQPFLSQLCSGARNPSDRTLSDLSKLLGVSYKWLDTGQGDMLSTDSDSEMFVEWAGDHLSSESDDFKRRFMRVIINFSEDDWKLIEKWVREMNSPPCE